MKTVMTVEDLRAELRQASARARELPHQQRYNRHPAIVLRDELIRAALDIGLRPALIRADTGLARSRIYQIRDAEPEGPGRGGEGKYRCRWSTCGQGFDSQAHLDDHELAASHWEDPKAVER